MNDQQLRGPHHPATSRQQSQVQRSAFPESLVDLIANQAARTPERIAIAWSGGDAWSYAQLMHCADAIARKLVACGVARGDLVGISVPRRPEMIAAVLGVMRAGAAYVALDPAFPAARLRYMAEHAGIRDVLVWHADADTIASLPDSCHLVALDRLDADAPSVAELPRLSSKDLAYVLYTSGSTGQPKGVRILQRNLINFLASMRHEPGITEDDVVCAITTLSFDIAALEIYLPLLVGARIVVATEAEQADPAALAGVLTRNAVTVLQSTPTLLQLLVGSNPIDAIRGMKLLVGGEPMPRDLADKLLRECGELWNMYGPTETTVWSTIHRATGEAGPVPLGRAIADTTIHVLDDNMSPVARGVVGEIWIGGAGVADGYLNDPAKTAERFVEDPFAADGSRMYRTGDLGSLRDGVLHFHGRVDDQIKLNGFRIEPGDIEAAALAQDGIHQAVAVVRELGAQDKRIVLYVVARPGPDVVARLRAALNDNLPFYMQPRLIELLDSLPRTPNGKIDRQALPMPKGIADSPGLPSGDKPLRGLEAAFAAIWSELLKVRDVGLHDDFFALGGDSLLAVRVFERAQSLTGVNLPLSTLLTGPTVAQQAAAFRAAGAREPDAVAFPATHSDQWSPVVPIQSHGTRPPLFLIHALGGNVLNYVPLARGLGAEQPVYGIQAIGLDGVTPPIGSVPTMAACYVAEIQRLQPRGPYYLAGGSMGGLVAYEMAQQLREQGETIALLGMIDTYGPDCWRGNADVRPALPLRIAHALFWRPLRLVDAWRVHRARAAGRPLSHALRYREIERVHFQALAHYDPAPYEGSLVLFRGSDQPGRFREFKALGWKRMVQGKIEVIALPGNHDNVIEQPELLRQLRNVLERAQLSAPS